MSPFLAVSILSVFANKKSGVNITRKVYEDAQDALVSLLEKANDEQYRLLDIEPHKEIQDENA